MFPSNGSLLRRPLPSTGCPRSESPGFIGTMRRSDFPTPITLRFVSFAQRLPVPRVCVRSFRPDDADRRPGAFGCGSPLRRNLSSWGRWVLSGSWGILLRLCPVLGPRSDRSAHQAIRCAGMAPAERTTRAPHDAIFLSRLYPRASTLAVYASRCGSLRPTQDSLPAASQALPGGIGYPQDSIERFP
jgi:hypothetical protein